MASNVYLVKVLDIEERETFSDSEEISKYKRIEVMQEVGWWMNKFHFNMFPNHKPYETVAVGDKLFLRVSMSKNCSRDQIRPITADFLGHMTFEPIELFYFQ